MTFPIIGSKCASELFEIRPAAEPGIVSSNPTAHDLARLFALDRLPAARRQLICHWRRQADGRLACRGEPDIARPRIAASIACHAAIKVNMPLEQNKMEWLLAELAKTDAPMTCPHGRPVVLRYSIKDIQRAFKRI